MLLGLSREELLDDVGLSSLQEEVDLVARYGTYSERLMEGRALRFFVKCVADVLAGRLAEKEKRTPTHTFDDARKIWDKHRSSRLYLHRCNKAWLNSSFSIHIPYQ